MQIAPAAKPMDFSGSRLQTFTRSADGGALYVALAPPPEHALGPAELLRYVLRADRWVLEGEPSHTDGQVVALTLFGNRQYPGALSLADIQSWVEEEVIRCSCDRQRPAITARTDLLRAPFWQVSTTTYSGPSDPKTRGSTSENTPLGIGPIVWQGRSAVVGSKRGRLAAQPLKPSSQNAL